MRHRAVVAGVLAAWLSGNAEATDQVIRGARLVLKRASNGAEKLLFVARDPGFLFPALGSLDDPTRAGSGGMLIELVSAASGTASGLVAPGGSAVPGWSVRQGTMPRMKFLNAAAPNAFSDVKTIVLRERRSIRILARNVGLPLDGPQGAVGVRITTGTLRNCVWFPASTVLKDEVGSFVAREAPRAAIADCSDASLGGSPTTTTTTTTTTATTTTTTTLAGVCGDGLVNQPTERCDGADTSGCVPSTPSQCGPPGFSTACQCCTYGGPFSSALPCCNPSSIRIPVPVSSVFCVPTRCDPPFTCGSTSQCQPDGSCCGGPGGECALALGGPAIPLNPCCPGLLCAGTSMFGGTTCCAFGGASCTDDVQCCSQQCGPSGTCEGCRASGAACTSDGDCCTTHCDPAGTCAACAPAGAACTPRSPTQPSPFECCSLSCNASGTCDACGPAGAVCFGNETCCSGSCDLSSLACNP